MKRLSLVALLVLGVVALFSVDAVACKNCGCSKKASSCSKKAGCPVQAALAKANLTTDQQKKVDAILTECKASFKKAADCGYPKKSAALKAEAKKGLQAKLMAVLTPEQKKALVPVFAKQSGCSKKTGSCSKSAGGCGK